MDFIYYSYILTAITCSALTVIGNGMIVYSSDRTEPHDYGTTAMYECDPGYEITGGDSERTCTGDSSSPSGLWDGTAPQCPRMFMILYLSCHMITYTHTQLWTVGLLRLLPMDLLGHQQPQHSQGQ